MYVFYNDNIRRENQAPGLTKVMTDHSGKFPVISAQTAENPSRRSHRELWTDEDRHLDPPAAFEKGEAGCVRGSERRNGAEIGHFRRKSRNLGLLN
jgi:hypothetical protein